MKQYYFVICRPFEEHQGKERLELLTKWQLTRMATFHREERIPLRFFSVLACVPTRELSRLRLSVIKIV